MTHDRVASPPGTTHSSAMARQRLLFAHHDGYATAKVLQWLRSDLVLWETCIDAAEACLGLTARRGAGIVPSLSTDEARVCLLARALWHLAEEALADEPPGSLATLLIRDDRSRINWEDLAERVLASLRD